MAALIRSGSLVSTDNGTPRSASAAITGSTRDRSSAPEMLVAPGRVDSPPMSSTAAPSWTSCMACARTAPISNRPARYKAPPSENESGVTLITPMTRARLNSSRYVPQTSTSVLSTSASTAFQQFSVQAELVLARRPTNRRHGSSATSARSTTAVAIRLAWSRASHDVFDLIGVQRFELHQGLCHEIEFVAVVL